MGKAKTDIEEEVTEEEVVEEATSDTLVRRASYAFPVEELIEMSTEHMQKKYGEGIIDVLPNEKKFIIRYNKQSVDS